MHAVTEDTVSDVHFDGNVSSVSLRFPFLSRTPRRDQVTGPTIASWLGRLEEAGPIALVQMCAPVNRCPDFVRYAVQRLKTLFPSLGKVKIAQTLTRAGLHLGATTVGRILREDAAGVPPILGTAVDVTDSILRSTSEDVERDRCMDDDRLWTIARGRFRSN